jgi:hypothetical protein
MSENLRSGRPKGKAPTISLLSASPRMSKKSGARRSINREASFEIEED